MTGQDNNHTDRNGGIPTPMRRGTCLPYEKTWNGIRVDKSLKSSWLRLLNSMSCFVLINICEGHVNSQYHRERKSLAYPRIYIKMTSHCSDFLLSAQSIHAKRAVSKLNDIRARTHCADMHIDVETNQSCLDKKEVILRIESSRPRHTEPMEPETVMWFEVNIRLVRQLDSCLNALVKTGKYPGGHRF